MKKNVAGQKIGAQMVSATDGSAFTSAVTVYITLDAGAQAIGSVGAGACAHEGNGYHTYAPAQAETNGDLVAATFIGTNAVPATLQIWPSFPQTTDNPSSLPNSGALTTIQADLDDIQTRIPAALVGGRIDANIGAISSDAVAADNAEAFFDGTGYAGTGNVIPTVTTLTGHTPQTGDAFTRLGAPAGASVSADIAAVKVDTAAILVDTGTTLDARIPAALVGGRMDSSVGAMAANVLTAAAINADAITDAKVAADVTIASVTGAVGSVTGSVGSVAGAVGSVTGNVGGNVVGSVASVVGAVGSVTGLTAATVHADLDDIQARLPAALTAGGNMKADVLAINGSTNSAANIARSTQAIVLGTVGAASSTTSIVTSALDPSPTVADQLKGRIVTFDRATTTAALRGQATDITANTSGGVLTVTALTTAPASGDTFTIT